jgi:hypothetical protein
MRYVTWLMPYFTTTGFLDSKVLPSASALALFRSRSFLAALSSGRYFNNNLNKLVAGHGEDSCKCKRIQIHYTVLEVTSVFYSQTRI